MTKTIEITLQPAEDIDIVTVLSHLARHCCAGLSPGSDLYGVFNESPGVWLNGEHIPNFQDPVEVSRRQIRRADLDADGCLLLSVRGTTYRVKLVRPAPRGIPRVSRD